jgi:hypothetical protein
VLQAPFVTGTITDRSIQYPWDDQNVEQATEPIDEAFYERLQGLSLRANVAFAIGTSLWLLRRLETSVDVSLPLRYLEAAVAQSIDWRYGYFGGWQDGQGFEGHTTYQSSWFGPVKGPIETAMLRVSYAVSEAFERGNPTLRCAWLTNLTQYVLPDREAYLSWRDQVIARYEILYPINASDPLGEVVPTESLDLAYAFQPARTEALMNQFLAGLDYRENQFLRSPGEIRSSDSPERLTYLTQKRTDGNGWIPRSGSSRATPRSGSSEADVAWQADQAKP